MKNRATALVVLLLAATIASGAKPPGQWFLYWFDKEAEYSISLDSAYRASGNNAVVVTYKEKLATGQNWLIGEVFNCPTGQYTLATLDEFDRNNKVVSRYKNENPAQTYKPASISERQGAVLNGVCVGFPKRPAPADAARSYFESYEKDVKKIRDGR
ncbi:MAG TPA: hypothetical protein VNW97_13685 [Candidatus Saccharimonadales bacterium]|nr:hypothetical protein [Candidatus Saccharimonadales bacterium]